MLLHLLAPLYMAQEMGKGLGTGDLLFGEVSAGEK